MAERVAAATDPKNLIRIMPAEGTRDDIGSSTPYAIVILVH